MRAKVMTHTRETDRQTDKQMEAITLPPTLTWLAINLSSQWS